MTETAGVITALLDDEHEGRRLASAGRAAPGVETRVVDAMGRPVPTGQPGEAIVRGLNVMKGYWRRPDDTRNAFFGDWLRTGDIATMDDEGFLCIVDRGKDMIVTGGENVYSTEVEAVVYGHPAVKEAAVIATPDPQWGELVTACIVLRDGATLGADELREFCRARLAHYKLPRRVVFYETELPKSGTGKILKRALREPFWKGQARQVG
jgi:long-chain acyl-CoA synthetase